MSQNTFILVNESINTPGAQKVTSPTRLASQAAETKQPQSELACM